MTPVAGSCNRFRELDDDVGLADRPAFRELHGAGLSFASPSGAPFFAQALSISISASVSSLVFLKCPTDGSANHGGIVRPTTAFSIARAYGRVCA